MAVTILKGDCREVLRTLPDESVHCVVTSPPYWGLRDYGVDGQLGLEPDFNAYIANMVAVFRELRQVLRADGTLWLNLGDSYNAHPGQRKTTDKIGAKQETNGGSNTIGSRYDEMLKPKNLCGIPWRVAFALQADGWYLRQDIIWSKPNPMPESVTDRCTKAHEYLFLLSKSARYYYDAEAIKEDVTGNAHPRGNGVNPKTVEPGLGIKQNKSFSAACNELVTSRNKRSVWEVTTQPFSEAHFATFPPALIEPCILAGCPGECCAKCGAPWVRESGREFQPEAYPDRKYDRSDPKFATKRNLGGRYQAKLDANPKATIGFSPSCSCNASTVPGTVLDPFGGAGTTGLVADRLGRNALLIELNPEYAAMAERRIKGDAPLLSSVFVASA